MDVSHGILSKSRVTAGLEPRLMGRWFRGLTHLRLIHSDIRTTESGPGEIPIALLGHYLIGTTFGVAWALIAHQLIGSGIRFGGGVLFGVATNAAPWLLMFPAMGLGFFGS